MTIRIATRGSALALWQANHIKSLIEAEHDVAVELKIIKTTGDKIQDRPLAAIGGKGLFVKEIEQALLDGSADLAVHSMKDVPAELPDGLIMYANPKRATANDALLSVKYASIAELPDNAVVGTSSLRRKLQLLHLKPNLVIKDLRGNVDTRINKLIAGEYDAIILAQAGLERLELTKHIKETIPVDIMIPAVCQGVLGLEIRKDDEAMKKLLAFLKDRETEIETAAERAFLQRLNGGCQTPIACHAVISGEKLSVTGYLADIDGRTHVIKTVTGYIKDAATLGRTLAETLLNTGIAIIK